MANTIITLSREYCTGGRFIAQDVADALGVKLYDKELITMAARDCGRRAGRQALRQGADHHGSP